MKSMSPEERSIENGIWLCASCAKKIDRDEQRYPATSLQAWKATAEEYATNELGRPLPSNSDTIHQLTVALTGAPKNFIPAAISNTHTATGIALERIDPRFRVETTYQSGVTTFLLQPKEPVPFRFNLTPEAAERWRVHIGGLINHGLQATLSASGVELQGLPIVQEFFPGVDRIVLTPHGKAAVLKVAVGADTDPQRFLLDDLSGERIEFICRATQAGDRTAAGRGR